MSVEPVYRIQFHSRLPESLVEIFVEEGIVIWNGDLTSRLEEEDVASLREFLADYPEVAYSVVAE